MYLPHNKLSELAGRLAGELRTDYTYRLLYATDASVYRQIPVAVALPAIDDDIKQLIDFANRFRVPLIPRTAGTSLAGQVVGNGIVVDVSRHMTKILEINPEEAWVKVQPGVILDELNMQLKLYGLFFGPEASTSNRCMIGGMVGNNASGARSLVYGSTRDHTLEITALLSDGTEVTFGPLSKDALLQKCRGTKLENLIYQQICYILSNSLNKEQIHHNYPDPEIKRRNTGYALDLLLNSEPFTPSAGLFNMCKLLSGSEGTLAFFTAIKLNLVPLPPPCVALVCVHCIALDDAFRANLVALKHKPVAVELMDDIVIAQTENNIGQRKNRFFITGKPAAVLIVEFARESTNELHKAIHAMISEMQASGLGYYYPVVSGGDMAKVWALRKAGLGLLSNIAGDAKPVAVIEDTAVKPADLSAYIAEINEMLRKLELECVYYAHIASGELHLRPVLNLKNPSDVVKFRKVAASTARIVKKFNGSLSGEHGDGRLRGEFISIMLGDHIYRLMKQIKQLWDPNGIFNPGKITDTPKMDSSLRYEPGKTVDEPDTIFDFSETHGMLRAVEQCNGSGDCRKSATAGGIMCPSYMATNDEFTSTRARANILREFIANSTRTNRFNHREIFEILDLCLSCKGCKAECPSNVDITKYKAEFLYQYYKSNPIPLRTKAIAYVSAINSVAMVFPGLYNCLIKSAIISGALKRLIGFAQQRQLPLIAHRSLRSWFKRQTPALSGTLGKVYLFADEFTNYNDVNVGISAIRLLQKLGYTVVIPEHKASGRTFLSKGLMIKAQKLAEFNVRALSGIVSETTPLVGIEPSAILTFRDEYPDILRGTLKQQAASIAANALMFDEFIVREAAAGKISEKSFTNQYAELLLHGHCHQKVLSGSGPSKQMLSLARNYNITELNTGCCGMAGAFGYEKEHYDLSMKIGGLALFPAVQAADRHTIIAAPGTSCRQQIFDGTGRRALHPVEVLMQALLQ